MSGCSLAKLLQVWSFCMSMSLVSAALNTVVVFPFTTMPSVFPSCANDEAANAIGTTAATKRVDRSFIGLHLSPRGRDHLQTLHTRKAGQLSYREYISHERCRYVLVVPR